MSAPLVAALGVSAAVSLAAWSLRALTPWGSVAACLVGASVYAGTGWRAGAILLAFFIGSSAVSRGVDPANQSMGTKGSRRDAWQVLANGGVAAIMALGGWFGILSMSHAIWAITASLAVAAADTWASSIGPRSPHFPRDILTGNPVSPGSSGAVSWVGTAGAFAGAVSVSASGALALSEPRLLVAGLIIGMIGMTLDSLLGSGCQARYRCPLCNTPCERPIHRCGSRAALIGGFSFLNNDGVNAIATFVGGMAGMLTAALFS
ncbi:MAG: DUF92 domain-containing protein [Gemmatimonadota bacterium]